MTPMVVRKEVGCCTLMMWCHLWDQKLAAARGWQQTGTNWQQLGSKDRMKLSLSPKLMVLWALPFSFFKNLNVNIVFNF
jgi:hypothetical protein